MKKKVLISIGTVVFLLVMAYLVMDTIVGFGYKINIIDGKPAGLIKYHEEDFYRNKAINGRAVVIRTGESRYVFKLEDYSLDVVVSGYTSGKFTIDTQNITVSIDTSNILPDIEKFLNGCLEYRTYGTVGHFDIVDNEVVITDSEKCNVFDVEAILSYIALRINYDDIVSVDVNDYIVEQDSDITEKQNSMQSMLDRYDSFEIQYTDGFTITKDILYKYDLLKVEDDKIDVILDEDKIVNMLVRNLVGYNSIGIDRRFHTHDNKDITVTGGTYGDYIDYSSEAIEVVSMLDNLESETDRIPIMKQEAKFSLDTTYIEVDKTKQHIYYYKDGELVLDSDVVTGKPTSDRMTPSGVYFILNKTTDANLIGATWNVKSDRWMGVTYQGVGFHDASWRSSFGGEIYKSNGSHGCINTPKEAMFALYDMVEEGTPVVIY